MTARKVLLVDDDPILIEIAARALRAQDGVEVWTTTSGSEAIEIAERVRPDVILLDVQMPGLDGPATLEALRAREGTARLPVVFMSGLSRPAEAAELRALGATGVLSKPFTPQTLLGDIERLLSASSASAEAISCAAPTDPAAIPASLVRTRVGELVAAFERLREGVDPEAPGRLRLIAHRLRGTAGTCGFPLVGSAAGRIEDQLEAWEGADAERRASIEAALEIAVGDASYAARDEEHPPSIPAMNLVTARVLLVDANPAFVEQTAELARRQLIRLEGASNAEDALAMARVIPFDAAILDVDRARGDAPLELARALRALPGRQRLPLAFIATSPSVEQQVLAGQAGASLFFTKTAPPHELTAGLQRLLEARVGNPSGRVLAIDDDPDFLASLASMLRDEGFVVATCSDPRRVLDKLEEVAPDVLLLDVEMPGLGGLDVCRMVRMAPRWQHLPVFFLTAHGDMAARLDGFAVGGTDYVLKPVERGELLARIRSRLGFDRVLRERADRDSLTQLLSRRAFLEALSMRASEARRHGTTVSVCLLDIDRFKAVNDTHGHLAGDRVLAALGKLLASRFRLEDLRARWGGEEIVLAFPGVPADAAVPMLERVLGELRALVFEGEHGQTFSVTFSAGVAELRRGSTDVEAVLRLADKRLYLAKQAGRARVVGR